jgi:AAA15 family ATPase/GTPase
MNGDDDFDIKAQRTAESFLNKEDLNDVSESQLKMLYLLTTRMVIKNMSPVYIPAERILISLFTNNIFSLLQIDSSIPESIKRFGSLYEDAKSKTKQFDIDFMNIRVKFSKEKDTIHLEGDDVDIDFSQASSGMQSIIPMWSVFCNVLNDYERTIVVEEPELNLFPTLQVALICNMAERINASKANLVLTSHSPYILSVFDNLIYAKDVFDRADDERKEKVAALVNPEAMISYDDIAAYSFDDQGIVTFINDPETHSTGAYALDAASNETANVFNELLAIDNEL